MPLIKNKSIMDKPFYPVKPEIFKDNITPPPVATPPIEKVALKKVKQPLKPINFEYNIKSIDEDYKHFNIEYQPNTTKLKLQNNHLNLNKMNIKSLFQFEIHENFEDSYYNNYIYLTEEILNNLVEDNKQNEINDIDTYKMILFINVCKNYSNPYKHEIVDKYELYDENSDTYTFKNYKKFYEGDFSTYFNNRYKDNSVFNTDIMSRIKQFNYHYDKIYPHNYNKNDNPKEYNKVSKNKSNLKTQYRKLLEGADINTLNNIPALRMIVYIIENID